MDISDFSKMNLEQIKALAKFLGFGYYRVSKRKGQFIECDDTARDIFGIPLEDVELGKHYIGDIYYLEKERDKRVHEVVDKKCVPQFDTISAVVRGDYIQIYDICWCFRGPQGEPMSLVGLVKRIKSTTISPKMFRTFPRGLFELDENGCVVRVNDKFKEILEYPDEERLRGKEFSTLCSTPGEFGLFEEKIKENGSAKDILKLRKYSDEIIDVECFAQAIDEFGRSRWGMVTNVTKRERYYHGLDRMPTGFFYIEKDQLKQCNKHFAFLMGFDSIDDAIDKNPLDYFVSNPDQYLEDLFKKDALGKPLQNYEVTIRKPNSGATVTMSVDSILVKDWENKPIGRLGTIRDISDKIKLREDVKAAEERLTKTSKDVHNLVHTFLHPVVKYAGNAELFSQISTTLQKNIQSKMAALVNPNIHAKDLANKLQSKLIDIRKIIPETSDEIPFTLNKKNQKANQPGKIGMKDLRDNITRMINVFDYTINKSQSAILLDEATRDTALWALDEFGHLDLTGNDTLKYNIDQGFFEFLQSILFNYLLRISNNLINETEMMKRQVEALSKYIGLKEEQRIVFTKRDVGKLLEEAIRIFNPVFLERNIEIEYYKSGNLRVEISQDDLDRVLCNLLHNASKYSHPGPERFVKIRAVEIGNRNEVELSIESYGIPIKQDEITSGRIWNFGYRGDMAYATDRVGSGVGLADARDVLFVHNGSISIDSVPVGDDGDPPRYKSPYLTKVTLWLPRIQPKKKIQ